VKREKIQLMKTKHIQLVKRVCAILPFCLFTFLPSLAQTFTQRIQQTPIGGARVVIHQDATIDELVNGKPEAPVQQQRRDTGGQNTRQQNPRNNGNTGNTGNTGNLVTDNDNTQQATDSLVQAPQRTRKVMGYRIQAFVGGKTRADRQKAEQTASALRTLFPAHKVYVHFYSPRWICRMGNFRTLAEAKEVLDEVVRMGYDTATLVRGQVTVPY